MPTKPKAKATATASSEITDETSPLRTEIISLADEATRTLRTSCRCALLAGLRLLHLYHHCRDREQGFAGEIEKLSPAIARPTAYRWLNAAARVLVKSQGIADPADLIPPRPGTPEFASAETILTQASDGMSLARLTLGAPASGDPERMDSLITQTENGDPHAAAALEKVEAGEWTLVQAIRGAAGAASTKDKNRRDPIYLDLDGATGQPKGLFPKAIITLANTFARWDQIDPAARAAARATWKAMVASLPADLR